MCQYQFYWTFFRFIGIKLENRPKKTQDFCSNARKRRRRVPKGTLEGADAAFEQKDKFYGMVFKFNAYSEYKGMPDGVCPVDANVGMAMASELPSSNKTANVFS